MGQKPDTSPNERFIQDLRGVLNHLYDPAFLRHSRLAELFGVAGRFDTPSALQNILIKAIEALRPTSTTPNKSHAQAVYDVLIYRYVQQVTQEEIASQLGISVRQLRRQQNASVLELAYKLWDQYDLDHKTAYAGQAIHTASPTTEDGSSKLAEELGWLKNSTLQGTTALAATLPVVLDLIQPLAQQNRTRIICQPTWEGLASVHPVVFQEIVLNLLSLAIHYAPGTEVRLDILPSGSDVTLHLHSRLARIPGEEPPEITSRKEIVSQLAQLSHNKVEFGVSDQQFRASVTFRSTPAVSVLVIDDNPEIVTVMQRFAAETRYRITGISDPDQSIEQSIELKPDILVLDIMMPQVDGLQILSRLKHHPQLAHIPVVICSVLPETELAVSLGANGFVQKPLRRDAFIATLNQYSRSAE